MLEIKDLRVNLEDENKKLKVENQTLNEKLAQKLMDKSTSSKKECKKCEIKDKSIQEL